LSVREPDADILISAQQDGSVTAFDLSGTSSLGRTFGWNSPEPASVFHAGYAVNRESSLLAINEANGTVAIIDLRTLRPARTLFGRDGSNTAAISFMPDGRTLVIAGGDGRVSFWDVSSGSITRTLRVAQPLQSIVVSPDGKLLAVQAFDGSDNRVEVVRIATGAVVQSQPLAYQPCGVEFTHDGREVVALGCGTSSASRLVAWDVRTGRQPFDPGRPERRRVRHRAGLGAPRRRYRRWTGRDARPAHGQTDRATDLGREERGRSGLVLARRAQLRGRLE
jgi:WD40 repeat protein